MCAERYRLSTAMHPPRAAHTAAALTVEPRARMLHIGARRAHACGLPAMLQLCSPLMSRHAHTVAGVRWNEPKNGGLV